MDAISGFITAYTQAGFFFVRILKKDGRPTKAPTAKRWNQPKSADNPHGYAADPAQAEAWLRTGDNIGLALVPSGVVAFDIDDLDETRRVFDGLGLPLDEWLADPNRVEIQSGKAGKGKLLFKVGDPSPPPSKKLTFGKGKHQRSIFELRHGSADGRTLQDLLPPSIHPDTGQAYRLVGDVANLPPLPPELLALWTICPETLKSFDPAYQPPPEPAQQQARPPVAGERDTIAEFNQAYSLENLLERHGYRRKGGRYLRPGSESGIPGVAIFQKDGRTLCYSHGADELNDGHAHDAFDVYRILACGGDWKKALGWNPEITRQNQAAWLQSQPAAVRSNEAPRAGSSSRRKSKKRPLEALTEIEFTAPEYPIDVLGPLAEPCRAIAEDGQMDPAMAGQCLQSSAALLAQSRANVRTLAGIKPLACYRLTIGDTGEGKSTAEEATLQPAQNYQRNQTRLYQDVLAEHEERCAVRGHKQPRPAPPREPYILTKDGTVEGIRRGFSQGLPSQGVFTSEAAVMLCGYGMNADNRSKSAGVFNQLWDNGEVSVSRGTAGRIQLYDRRLSLHWLIQPEAARQTLHDTLLSSIGFWPRFLVAWPAPGKPRVARPFDPSQDSRIKAFWARCEVLLAAPQPDDCGNLPVLEMTPEALAFVCKFFERMEQAAKVRGGALEPIKPFAARATEQLCRVAGGLAAFAGEKEISLGSVRDAGQLAGHSLETWRGIFGDRELAEARGWACKLFAWLCKQTDGRASETAILRIGPKEIRTKVRRDTALALLEAEGRIERAFDYWSVRRG